MNPAIFTQAFLAQLIPTQHEVLLGAIRHFQFAQYPQNAALATLGALGACLVLFGIGILLRRLPERVSTPEPQQRIVAVRGKAQDILPWLLVFAPLPVGGLVVIAAGFFRVKPVNVALILIASETLYRAMPYL